MSDLISRSELINARPEFRNEEVVRDTKYRTTKERIYAKAWNACNSYWLDIIDNAPTVLVNNSQELVKDLVKEKAVKKSDNLCDDCKVSDTCALSLKGGLTGCKTTKCFKYEWAKKEETEND